jgi:hypothetical protein
MTTKIFINVKEWSDIPVEHRKTIVSGLLNIAKMWHKFRNFGGMRAFSKRFIEDSEYSMSVKEVFDRAAFHKCCEHPLARSKRTDISWMSVPKYLWLTEPTTDGIHVDLDEWFNIHIQLLNEMFDEIN